MRDVVSSVSQPAKQLRGFEKVFLKPGEAKDVQFTLTSEDLSLLNQDMKRVVEPGEFHIMVGASSNDIRLRGSLTAR
jgi:beta-glucosidase